ncbi:MAG: M48 family metalloprotease [Promethearchaeota archaeon]
MDKSKRNLFFILYIFAIVISIFPVILWCISNFEDPKIVILSILFLILTLLLSNEAYHWTKNGLREDSADLVLLSFLFITIFLLTDDVMNSFIGAFSIYLIIGMFELKEYDVLNKILLITVITYNFIFIAGLVNTVMNRLGIIDTPVIRDTAFSFSIWIMLILGFALFGRKYIVVFRFMSPQYLTMFLFIFAWLAVRFISNWWVDITGFIYLFMILTNWIVYFISGPILDFTLGIKRTDNEEIVEMVSVVQQKIGLKGNIKVGFGSYPILNAMAYGAVFDQRIAIIAEDIDTIPKDELKGIIGHELNHLKGKHTLILSIISTFELIIFWILGWPITYYDYVFNPENQPFDMWIFILLNLLISIFLYVFIRVLEAKADLNTKKAGLGNELAKGLYNLEGFYASGRELGLDTMLLCDEKPLKYNKIADYADTAEYLNKNMVSPGRLTLLSNLINSHPPSYHRIISMYSEEKDLSPWRESILPFSLISRKKSRKFAFEYWNNRKKFSEMANQKFRDMSGIKKYTEYMKKLNKKELYDLQIGKTFLFLDKLSLKIGTGILADIQFNNDVCEPVSYIFYPVDLHFPDEEFFKKVKSDETEQLMHKKNGKRILEFDRFYKKKPEIGVSDDLIDELLLKNHNSLNNLTENSKLTILNPITTKLINIEIGAQYHSARNKTTQLLAVKLPIFEEIADNNRNYGEYRRKYKIFMKRIKKEAHYVFKDSNRIYSEPILDYKIRYNTNTIKNALGKEIFINENGILKIFKLKEYIEKEQLYENTLICENQSSNIENTEEQIKEYKLGTIIVKNNDFSLIIRNNKKTESYEDDILKYLLNKKLRTTVYLKKPVNDKESGYIQEINIDEKDRKKNSFMIFLNIYEETIKIPFNKMDVLLFSQNTISLIDKKKISLGEKMIQKIIKWRKPHNIFNP